MSDTDPAGKIRRIGQTVTEHPVLAVIGLLVASGTVARIIEKRRTARLVENVELPVAANAIPGTARDANLIDALREDVSLGDIREDDNALKDLARGDGDIEGGGDPIADQIRP